MVDWWSETEHAIVECLGSDGPMSPEDLAQRVGISEGETTAFLCMLAREKKVLIRLVGVNDKPASRPPRGAARVRGKAPAQRQAAHAGGH
jgi:DNA-binding Lrp family transcriptional regulator